MNKRLASNTQGGFTIIEVLVAIFLLLVGVLATVTLVNNANAVTTTTKAREGATNLARQLLEVSHTVAYDKLDNSTLNAVLQTEGFPDDDTGQSGWQIIRRGIKFNVSSWACIFDEAKDGARTQSQDAADTYCPGSATPVANNATSGKDQAPDDFRRVEFDITWTLTGSAAPACRGQTSGTGTTNVSTGLGSACVTMMVLIPNPSGGLGPGIQSADFDHSCCTIGQSPDDGAIELNNNNPKKLDFTVVTTSAADKVAWTADDGNSGLATADAQVTTNHTWRFTWTWRTNPPLSDGPHTVEIQAFLANVAGAPLVFPVTLNQNIPPSPNMQFTATGPIGGDPPPAMIAAGVNTRRSGNAIGAVPIVEFNWHLVGDNDIAGYRVYKTAAPAGTISLTGAPLTLDTLICPNSGPSTLEASTTSSCYDPNPPAVTGPLPGNIANYYVVALDTKWNPRTNPNPMVAGVDCPLLGADLTYDTGLFPTNLRPGCPSAVIPVDINLGAQNSRPFWPAGAAITKTTDSNGLPHLDWSAKPACPDSSPSGLTRCSNATGAPIQFYRIYRDPASLSNPLFTERYSRTDTNVYTDPAPADQLLGGTCDSYSVTAVDSNWQESDPISVGCP